MSTVSHAAGRFTATAAVVLLLAACAGGAGGFGYKVYGERFSPRYSYDDIAFFNAGKEMTVDVLNDPFGVGREDLADRIALSMSNKNEGAPIAFTARPGENTPPQTRILVAFNTPSAESGSRFCAADQPQLESGEPPLRVLMVFCKRDEFMSSVRGETQSVQSVDDPNFRQMLALVTRKVIPIEHPFNENRGDPLRKTPG